MIGFSDNTINAENIVEFIQEKYPSSPMLSEEDIGNCFISAGQSNNVNPAFLIATACLEGGFGTAGWATSHPECHNTFGYGIPSGTTQPDDLNCMDSWCAMIQRVASVIAHGYNYYTQGLYTVSQVRAKYAASPNADSIANLMNELYTFSISHKETFGPNAAVEALLIGTNQSLLSNQPQQQSINLSDLGAYRSTSSGVELNTAGESKIFWVFDTPDNEWSVTGGPGSFVSGFQYGHCGDDYYANDLARKDHSQYGKPVYAGIDGIVYAKDIKDKSGNYIAWGKEIIIYNPESKFALRYAHLSEYDSSLNGKWISATSNKPLGKVGDTGLGSGPHLHLVLYKNVNSIDKGNPVSISSCSVQNGACVKSATEYAAKFSFIPRINDGSSMENPQQEEKETPVTLILYVHEGDANGPTISGTQVTGHDGSGKSFGGTTDSNGYVTITGDRGTWSFTASVDGYAINSWDQDINEDCTKHAYLQKEETKQELVHETLLPSTSVVSPQPYQQPASQSVNDITGSWVLNYVHRGDIGSHKMIIDTLNPNTGDFKGHGWYLGDPSYEWDITGAVNGNNITFHITYTGLRPEFSIDALGVISSAVFMSGKANDTDESTTTWNAAKSSNIERPNWDITGRWQLNYQTDKIFSHKMLIDTFNPNTGDFKGRGQSLDNPAIIWDISGTIDGDNIAWHIAYTGLNPTWWTDAVGVISSATSMSGKANSPNQIATWNATKNGS
jgi:murein DD-endopeptidase MepM/ murein hydrolase activator NlpD